MGFWYDKQNCEVAAANKNHAPDFTGQPVTLLGDISKPIPSRDRLEGQKLLPVHMSNKLVTASTELMILEGMVLSLENRPQSIGHFTER
ncbi:MAG: hypothetical protein WCA07_16660 [Gloeobacterales cyanobacterium]